MLLHLFKKIRIFIMKFLISDNDIRVLSNLKECNERNIDIKN